MIHQYKAEQTDAGLNFDIQLDEGKRFYCFIGENGCGKTNFLENFGRSLLYCHSMFWSSNDTNPTNFTYLGLYWFGGESLTKAIKDLHIDLASVIKIQNQPVKEEMNYNAKWNSIPIQQLSVQKVYPLGVNVIFDYPLIMIGAKQRGHTGNISGDYLFKGKINKFIQTFKRTYQYLKGESLPDTAIADWLAERLLLKPSVLGTEEYVGYQGAIDLLTLIQTFSPDITLIKGENKEMDVLYQNEQLIIGGIPINKFSTGFVAIIKIFQEIISAYESWSAMTQHSPKSLRDLKGVVLIDEIDAHLHPKWQNQIVSILKEAFPNTTFYVTTHSPVIAATTDEGESYELIRNGNDVHTRRLGNPQAWYLTSLYLNAFHVSLAKPKIIANGESKSLVYQLNAFSNLIKNYNISSSQQEKESLKQRILDSYNQLIPHLPEDDPRRRSLDNLMTLVK